ncbi:MAG: peptidoglycan D,D-transpeptidase FtsI family protein [Candidatus Levyibacteriota bacterium]
MKWRYLCSLGFFIICFLLVTLRLGYWQVVKASELSQLGQQQYGKVVQINPTRGDIQASDGFPLASNMLSYLIFADPKEIANKSVAASVLSSDLSMDKASVSAILDFDKFWVPIKDHIDTKDKVIVEKENLPGIGFQDEYTRFYPEASLAASLLGFVGKDDVGNDKGYFGLEGYYDRQLRGRSGEALEIHDAMGRPVLSKAVDNAGAQDGRTLVLHIDRTIQFLVEDKLKAGIQTYGAQSGMVAVMDPKTGGILAMANFPTFDPRSFSEYDQGLYINPFITDLYEPGSTFKPLVMSAAIESNVVKPDTKCTICSGPVTVGDYMLHTWDDKYFPNTSMIDVIIHSDNTGMVFVAQKLGLDRMLSFLNAFGIGSTTGIDLQGEEAPGLKPKENWYPIDLATAGFGQGISVTPIELLDAFSTIANNGMRMEPHIVDKIITPDNQTIIIPPKVLSKPISEQTAKVMTEILVDAVNKGEASFARLQGYRIAGKTGTASIPVNGHYDPMKTIASFIGFAPADNPKFVMIVILNKPTASIYGAETAAPIFFSIAKDLMDYYGISPTSSNN